MLHFLQHTQYHIKTAFGTSEEYYSNLTTAIYGVLKGSGSAPAIWLAVSINLINTYNKKFQTDQGTPNPTGSDFITKMLNAFVDDTDLWDVTTDHSIPINTLVTNMQTKAQYWENCLFTTGRKLSFKKCFWYLVTWNWDDDGHPTLSSINDHPIPLELTYGDSTTPIPITRKDSLDALHTLGFYSSPSGQQTTQFQVTATTLRKITKNIKSTPMTHQEGQLLIQVYLHTKLHYIFAATALSKKQCEKLVCIYRQTTITKMGICSTTSRTIIHSSYRYSGYQIPTCWDLQGATHLYFLTGHLQLQDLLGQHLQHSIDFIYLHLGLTAPVFSYPYENIQHLIPPSWLASTWEYATDVKAQIKSQCLQIPQQCEKDIAINKLAVNYAPAACKRINASMPSDSTFKFSISPTMLMQLEHNSTLHTYNLKVIEDVTLFSTGPSKHVQDPKRGKPGALSYTNNSPNQFATHTLSD